MKQKVIPAWKLISPLLVLVIALAGFIPFAAQAQGTGRPVISYATRSDATGPLKDLPQF